MIPSVPDYALFIRAAFVAVLLLFSIGCDLAVEGGIPTVSDDRIVGNWANNGKLMYIIRRSSGREYHLWTDSEVFQKGEKPMPFFLGTAGGVIFAQLSTDKTTFSGLEPASPQNSIFLLFRLNITSDRIEIFPFQVNEIVSDSRAGLLKGVAHKYRVTVSKDGGTSIHVLLTGNVTDVTDGVAKLAKNVRMHTKPLVELTRM